MMMRDPLQTIGDLIQKQSAAFCGRYYSNFHSEDFTI